MKNIYSSLTYTVNGRKLTDYINENTKKYGFNLTREVESASVKNVRGIYYPDIAKGVHITPYSMVADDGNEPFAGSSPYFENYNKPLEKINLTQIDIPENSQKALYRYDLVPHKIAFDISNELENNLQIDLEPTIAKKLLNSYLETTHKNILMQMTYGARIEDNLDINKDYISLYDMLVETVKTKTVNNIIIITQEAMSGLLKATADFNISNKVNYITFEPNTKTGVQFRGTDVYVVKDLKEMPVIIFGSIKQASYDCVVLGMGDHITVLNYDFNSIKESNIKPLDTIKIVENRNELLNEDMKNYGKYIGYEYKEVNEYNLKRMFVEIYQQVKVDYEDENYYFKGFYSTTY